MSESAHGDALGGVQFGRVQFGRVQLSGAIDRALTRPASHTVTHPTLGAAPRPPRGGIHNIPEI